MLMGPWMQDSAQIEVEVLQPSDPVMAAVIESMSKAQVQVIFGRWLIEGYPHVVLFDLGSSYHRLNEWKTDFWNQCHISTPPNDQETNDAVVFGYLVAWFLGEVSVQEVVQVIRIHFQDIMTSTHIWVEDARFWRIFMSGLPVLV